MDQRDQIQISLKEYAEHLENHKRVLRSNTNPGSNNQQQPTQRNPQAVVANTNNDRKNDKSSKIKKGSIQEEGNLEPDIQKKVKTSDPDNADKTNQGNITSESQKNSLSTQANWNAQSIQNDEVFEEIFKKFVDLERDSFLDIPELTSTLHGQFYLKDMNKIDSPYLQDSFVKVYSESQNLITIANGFVQQGTNKKKKRFMTIQSQKESKTFTQVCDCSKQDILILQNIACLPMDYQQFLKHIRPNEKSVYQFNDFTNPDINQVLWPVVLLSCYGPLKDNIRDLFTNDAYTINDTWDIFKFGNYRKDSTFDEQIDENKMKGKEKEKAAESQMNIESYSQINFPSQQNIPLQRSLSVQYQQNDVLIWFIGTNRYSIVNMSQLMKMEDINKEFVKELFKKTKLRDITKTLVDLIKSYNLVTNRNKEFVITAENCKQMIHRIVKVRNTKQFKRRAPQVTFNDDFYYAVILRFQENRQKQTMQLLIKNLENPKLHWINLNQSERNIVTSLNIPALGPQELKFNYYLDIQQKDAINPKEIALSFINRFLLRWFYEKSAITPLREAEVDKLLQESIRGKEFYTYENMPEKKRNKERCTVCKYILYNLEFKGCFYCGAYYHTQCIQQDEDNKNKPFACDTCEPCSICHGKITDDNITCCECKTHFHKKCGFSIAYDMNTSDKQIMRWYCESCVQCCICNNKLSDFQNGYSQISIILKRFKFKDDQIYCNDCVEQLQKKEYCPICKKFWSQETNKDMVQCTCAMWIHRACDPILKDDKLYDEYKNNLRQLYRCTNCRKRVRRVLMCQFIKVLSHLDFQKFFTKNEFEKIPNYLKLIKKPIDLYMMQRKAISGDYDNEPYESLYKDFLLLIQNALNFNAHHPEAYREATKLNLLGKTAFQYFQNLLKIDEKELITMTEKTSIQGKQIEFIKYIEQNFLNIVFNVPVSQNKSLTTIEIYNKQSERQQSNQSQMIEESMQDKRENDNSVQYQEYLRDVQKMEENNIKQFKYTEVSNLVEQGDAIYNYLSFLQQLMNESNQIVIKFEDICKLFEQYASKGNKEGKHIQQVLKNETLNKVVKYNQYLNDLMNNNTLDDSNDQNQQDNAHSDNSSQEGGVSSQFISFHNALKLEIENFAQKGKPFSFYECVPVKFTNQNINLLRQSSCFMCGAFDGYKSLLFCTTCFESYHPYCLMIPGRQEYFKEKMERAMNNREWNCPKCQVCKVCNKGPNITKNLYCRKCDAMAHFECEFKDIQVWNESKNELYWQCSDCFSCAKCQSKCLLDDSDKQLIVNLDFTDNFTLCYKCGFLDAYYRFCKFCNKYCKKIPSLPKPANQQPLDDLFQEKSVRLKYLDQYLEEVLYQCKLCQQVYHKKCFEKAYPEFIQQFFCYQCKESNQSYMQKIYENSLISTKCRIIHIRKVQEFLPIVELIIEKQAQMYRLNRKDIGDFIAEYLHYFESDQFGIYKQNTMAYEKLCQQLKDEGILISPYNIKQMAMYDEKIAQQSVEQLKNQKSYWREQFIQSNQFYHISEYLFSIAYLDQYKRGLTNSETAEIANKYLFDNNGGVFKQIQYNIFKLQLKESMRYDYKYNENGELEVIFIESDIRHPLYQIKEDQYQVFQQKVQQAIRERGLSNQSSSQAIQFPSRDGSNQPMEIEDSNFPSEQLIQTAPVKLFQNRFELSVVYSAYFNSTILNLQNKIQQENSQYQKSFKYYIKTPLLEERDSEKLSIVTGITKRRDIAQCIILLQAQEEQLVEAVRQMLDEFMEKKKDKTKISLTQQVLNSYQNFSKNILGSVYQTPMSYQEIINQFREAQKKLSLVDNNIIDDPMREIPCQLCSLKGTRKMCGRLLNFDVDKWVHANCALWSTEVKENIDGALKNFIPAYKKSLQVLCKHCNKYGATISCMIASCKDKYHFPCLLKSNGFMTDQKTVLCKSCWDIILKNDDTEIILKMQYLKLVNNFYTDRRMFISLTKQEGGNIDFSGECYNRFGSFILVNLDTQDTNDDEFFSSYFFMRYIRPFVSQKYQSYVTAFWLKKKKDEYNLKSCLLPENNKIFLQSKNLEENKNEFSIDKDRPFSNDISGIMKNSAGYKDIYETNNISRFTNNVLKDKDIFNHEQLDSFTSLKGIQQLLQEKINQIYQRFKSDQPNKTVDLNKFVMEYIGFGIPQIVKACQQSSKQNKNNNIFQNIQNIKVNSFQELFYKEQVENFNPFEKQKLLEKMHPTIILNQKQQQSQQNLGQMSSKENHQSSHLNIPILQHLSAKQQGFVHFQKQSQKPIIGNNYFIRPDDIMQEANPEYMKQDTRQTIREKEIEKKIKAEYPNYINSKKRHLNIYAGPSKIHKYGLFAKTHFKQDDIVVEYLGETIRQVLADYREKIYKQRGFGDCYMFKAGPDKIIDATFKGNEARYLNHSCNPNCSSLVIEYEKDSKIIIYAKRDIKPGEELTYDYCFDIEEEKINCNCDDPNCTKIMN